MFSIKAFAPFRFAALLAGLVLFVLAAAPSAHAQSSSSSDSLAAPPPDAVVHVKGMVCQMCARSMTNALQKLDAVEKAEVLLDKQQVHVTLKAEQTVTEEALRAAVEGAGYEFVRVAFAEEAGASGSAPDKK